MRLFIIRPLVIGGTLDLYRLRTFRHVDLLFLIEVRYKALSGFRRWPEAHHYKRVEYDDQSKEAIELFRGILVVSKLDEAPYYKKKQARCNGQRKGYTKGMEAY